MRHKIVLVCMNARIGVTLFVGTYFLVKVMHQEGSKTIADWLPNLQYCKFFFNCILPIIDISILHFDRPLYVG